MKSIPMVGAEAGVSADGDAEDGQSSWNKEL